MFTAHFALCHPGDAHHARIMGFFRNLEDGTLPPPSEWILTNLVLAEVLTLAFPGENPPPGG